MANTGFIASQRVEVKYEEDLVVGATLTSYPITSIEVVRLHADGTTSNEALTNLQEIINDQCDTYLKVESVVACVPISKPVVSQKTMQRLAIFIGDSTEAIANWIKRVNGL